MKTIVYGGDSEIAGALSKRMEVALIPYKDCDVRSPLDVYEKYQSFSEPVNIVNCAGVCHRNGYKIFSGNVFEEMQVNFFGALNITTIADVYPVGKIVHIASDAGLVGKPFLVGYAASKAGVISLVRSYGMRDKKVYAVAPTIADTKMNEGLIYDASGVLTADDIAASIEKMIVEDFIPGSIMLVNKREDNGSIVR